MQEEAVGEGAEEGRERVGRDVGRDGAAFLSGPGQVCHGLAKVVQEVGQAFAQKGVSFGFEHRFGPDSGYELLLLALLSEPWLEQGDEVGELFEGPELFDWECLLEHVQRGLGEELLFAAEVVADRAVRQVRPGGDSAGSDPSPPQFCDQLGGRAQEPRSRLFGDWCSLADRLAVRTVHMAKSSVEW